MNSREVEGLLISPLSVFRDERGTFSRLFDSEWFSPEIGIPCQINLSRNSKALTLRGMHYQVHGAPEHKVLTLLSGSIFLAVLDLRKDSSTYLNSFQQHVSLEDDISIFIPAGCAAGWLSLEDETDIHYVMYSRYEENQYAGLRYDDPSFEISWPVIPTTISVQDQNWPLFVVGN